MSIRDVEDILQEGKYPKDEFYELIVEAEKRAMKERFW